LENAAPTCTEMMAVSTSQTGRVVFGTLEE
jgi:hypothetical protein